MNNVSTSLAARAPAVAPPDLERLRQASERLVGSVFYGQMLQQMRDSKFQAEYGHGGRGEDAFAAQLHQLLAEKMGERRSDGLADAVYRHLEKQQRLLQVSESTVGEMAT